ncbi:acyl-ACP thioesterase domain-containing protein [Lactococcus kimchii]|uniref:acyl-ACP thioesterase domain-containing protein n=1 Tax=Lactococcus sp. S-13 TaxID=2507158 RepID=UPI0010233BD6|nr:acyl-ACP thioesterase domain-containing protein [Lactococcus sp. S-13]RZI48164.1 acyl-[acyl-carrier-protein] thioesterase [Lactococcus sp. S-13]
MGLKYQQSYRVPFYESDAFKKMRISSLLAVALQISGEQSTVLGRSDVWVAEKYGLFWAVIEYELKINRLPRFNEKLTIETEATSYNKFFCYRKFSFFAEDGALLLTINSTWVLMNQESRKIERVLDDIVAPYASEKIAKILRPHKFAKSDEFVEPQEMAYPVRFSDLDMNGHVNNAKYYDWAADMVAFDFRKDWQPAQIFIKYNHEVLYGEEIRALLSWQGQISHHNFNDGGTQIEIHWTNGSEKSGEFTDEN